MQAKMRMLARRRTCSRDDDFMKPAVLILALEQVVQHDLERPRFQEAGDAFAGDREQAEPQLAAVWAQHFKDAQAGLAVERLRIHELIGCAELKIWRSIRSSGRNKRLDIEYIGRSIVPGYLMAGAIMGGSLVILREVSQSAVDGPRFPYSPVECAC